MSKVSGIAKVFEGGAEQNGTTKESRVRGLASKFDGPVKGNDAAIGGWKGAAREGKVNKGTEVRPSNLSNGENHERLGTTRDKGLSEDREEGAPSFGKAYKRFESPDSKGTSANGQKPGVSVLQNAKRFEDVSNSAGSSEKQQKAGVQEITQKFSKLHNSSNKDGEKESGFAAASARFEQKDSSLPKAQGADNKQIGKAREYDSSTLASSHDTAHLQKGKDANAPSPTDVTKQASESFEPGARNEENDEVAGRRGRFAEAFKAFSTG